MAPYLPPSYLIATVNYIFLLKLFMMNDLGIFHKRLHKVFDPNVQRPPGGKDISKSMGHVVHVKCFLPQFHGIFRQNFLP